ncbi:Uncharacterized protein GBIM_13264 [Gryllus bimaculatus]|nr:Uncharacterized protein GBIM_13264 [Gryllus bimaculatus]
MSCNIEWKVPSYVIIFVLISVPGTADHMDKATQDNRTNQCNPNHSPTGPGHKSGYQGTGTKADLDNHSKQLNPNNPQYKK